MLSMEVLKSHLFPNWDRLQIKDDGVAFRHLIDDNMTCIVSDGIEEDDQQWRHISISHRNRMPDYDELKRAKELFAGNDCIGYLIFPEKFKHINIDPHCLHIFCPIEHKPLPDFTRGSNSI